LVVVPPAPTPGPPKFSFGVPRSRSIAGGLELSKRTSGWAIEFGPELWKNASGVYWVEMTSPKESGTPLASSKSINSFLYPKGQSGSGVGCAVVGGVVVGGVVTGGGVVGGVVVGGVVVGGVVAGGGVVGGVVVGGVVVGGVVTGGGVVGGVVVGGVVAGGGVVGGVVVGGVVAGGGVVGGVVVGGVVIGGNVVGGFVPGAGVGSGLGSGVGGSSGIQMQRSTSANEELATISTWYTLNTPNVKTSILFSPKGSEEILAISLPPWSKVDTFTWPPRSISRNVTKLK